MYSYYNYSIQFGFCKFMLPENGRMKIFRESSGNFAKRISKSKQFNNTPNGDNNIMQ